MKTLSTRQFAAVKRVYKNICPSIETFNKNMDKIHKLTIENEAIEAFIQANEAGVKLITGGIPSTDLVKKVIVETDKIGINGKPVKVTKYEPSDNIIYDDNENCYYIDEGTSFESPSSYELDDSNLKETEEVPSSEGAFDPTAHVEYM